MSKNLLWAGLMLGCTACSHIPFMHHDTPPPAKPVSTTALAPAPASTAAAPPAIANSDTVVGSDTFPAAPVDPVAPQDNASIAAPVGYETVAAARKSLEDREEVQTHADPQGWWIVEIPAEHKIWAFTPDDHPAHPAAVVREAVNEHGIIRIRMAVLCTASKEACDGLIADFKPVNEEMRKRLQDNL